MQAYGWWVFKIWAWAKHLYLRHMSESVPQNKSYVRSWSWCFDLSLAWFACSCFEPNVYISMSKSIAWIETKNLSCEYLHLFLLEDKQGSSMGWFDNIYFRHILGVHLHISLCYFHAHLSYFTLYLFYFAFSESTPSVYLFQVFEANMEENWA